jgi:hypothetical protein
MARIRKNYFRSISKDYFTGFKSVLFTTDVNPDLEMILVWSYGVRLVNSPSHTLSVAIVGSAA